MVELAPHEPAAVEVVRAHGRSPFFLTCDHASKRIPESLSGLGLPDHEIDRHIGWDIGAAAVAHSISEAFDATLVLQGYSRLVIDCNRQPHVESSIPAVSEATEVPGNVGLDAEAAAQRKKTIFAPYHTEISARLEERHARQQRSVLVALHSFTPVYHGASRPWQIGIQYNREPGLSRCMIAELSTDESLCIGDNQPYSVSDKTDYTIPVHAEGRGLPHLLIELRHDLIADEAGQSFWAQRLIETLPAALARFDDQTANSG
ncbi:N-formylglutamate amidohydrolase [Pelagibius sp. Alg239-R121]|uniref:N-formylglutamate amidohydrolase n=1 Tax=Pelagibius sp. Alg239-R121 TaxID=2993448 RepID=UPI0024A65979|nr:N-formylglutamate amidohydrolase [Pelagibius sp. Alg239-R121]